MTRKLIIPESVQKEAQEQARKVVERMGSPKVPRAEILSHPVQNYTEADLYPAIDRIIFGDSIRRAAHPPSTSAPGSEHCKPGSTGPTGSTS